jgi:hypothetical protein
MLFFFLDANINHSDKYCFFAYVQIGKIPWHQIEFKEGVIGIVPIAIALFD